MSPCEGDEGKIVMETESTHNFESHPRMYLVHRDRELILDTLHLDHMLQGLIELLKPTSGVPRTVRS